MELSSDLRSSTIDDSPSLDVFIALKYESATNSGIDSVDIVNMILKQPLPPGPPPKKPPRIISPTPKPSFATTIEIRSKMEDSELKLYPNNKVKPEELKLMRDGDKTASIEQNKSSDILNCAVEIDDDYSIFSSKYASAPNLSNTYNADNFCYCNLKDKRFQDNKEQSDSSVSRSTFYNLNGSLDRVESEKCIKCLNKTKEANYKLYLDLKHAGETGQNGIGNSAEEEGKSSSKGTVFTRYMRQLKDSLITTKCKNRVKSDQDCYIYKVINLWFIFR